MEYSRCLLPGLRTSEGWHALIKVCVVPVLRTLYKHHRKSWQVATASHRRACQSGQGQDQTQWNMLLTCALPIHATLRPCLSYLADLGLDCILSGQVCSGATAPRHGRKPLNV
ncbi:hypothetical protein JMJ77_0014483, partial [Colletotrichum scovillei]